MKEIIDKYEQVAILVQKNNDLDSSACALALALLIKENFENKKVKILGIYGKSRFLTEMPTHEKEMLDWSKDTLTILSEISSPDQLPKYWIKEAVNAKEVIALDHHEFNEEEFKSLKEKFKGDIHLIQDSKETSVCEVLLATVLKEGWKISKRIAEILFMGIYSDTKNITAESLSAKTFTNIAKLIELGNIKVGELINKLNQKEFVNLKLFAECVREAIHEQNMIFINLQPRYVQHHIPRLLYKGKDGRLRQKTLLTYIPRWIEQYAAANTIVFSHYSLYDPYNSLKKFVYVILVKENPALEHILREYKFKKNRNRWSREMNFGNLVELIEQYRTIFVS